MRKQFLLLLFFLATAVSVLAQDTLPKFSVNNAGNNRIIIGWINTFESIKQISIQRSFDSLTGYKTILTVPDPTTPQNGYADMKATNDHMFYRLYILLDKGIFLFSDAKKPVRDTIRRTDPVSIRLGQFNGVDSVAVPNPGVNKTKPNAFTPSLYVYTHRDGYVRISLPDEEKPKKYSIRFFDEGQSFLFELKDIKEKDFKLDKTNFFHAGWFRFELYEDEKLIERHKFYLEKDF
ncbi:MAG: hypothetical protein ABIR30_09695 [Chitinophagaceae bacterium]